MKWCEIKEDDYLLSEVTAMYMREQEYSLYKNADTKLIKKDGKFYSVLFNKGENPEELTEDGRTLIDRSFIDNEIKYVKSIFETTKEYIYDFVPEEIFKILYGHDMTIHKPISSFKARGGLVIQNEDESKKLIVSLNFLDLYDVSFVKDGKVVAESKDLYFYDLGTTLTENSAFNGVDLDY